MTERLHSVGHAVRGLTVLVKTQPNARIHVIATIGVVVAGALFGISLIEWGLVWLAVVCVWVTEGLNTSIEFLVDLVSPELQPLAAKAKDVAAGAVLLAAIGALIIGAVVFGPHIWDLLRR